MKKIMIVSIMGMFCSVFAQKEQSSTILVRCASAVTIASHRMNSVHNEGCDTCNNDICNDKCTSKIPKEYRKVPVKDGKLRIRSHYETNDKGQKLYQHTTISLNSDTKRVDLTPEIKSCESVGARVWYRVTQHDNDEHDQNDYDDNDRFGKLIGWLRSLYT